MRSTKIVVRNIPTLEPRTGHKKNLGAHQAKTASQRFLLSATPETREITTPNPLLSGVFVQLGITTDAWLVVRTMTGGI